jgi:hypothetical protein
MNPKQDTNEYITELKFNMEVILAAVDLGHPPQLTRAPSHNASEDEEVPLITDEPFSNTPNNFVMPEPCEQCYTFCCNGICSQETVLIPRQLSFEEDMELPPPPALTRRVTSVYLRDEEWKDMDLCPPPLTRAYTNAHLQADEPEDDESDEFDMPEGIQYVSISINKDEDSKFRPPPFTRMYTNDHLPADEPENKLLVALSEAESNMRDEYEEAFFKKLEDKKQDQYKDK